MPDLVELAHGIERDGYLLDSAAATHRAAARGYAAAHADLGEATLRLSGISAACEGLATEWRAAWRRPVPVDRDATTLPRRWWQP
jgi:hypothetical protein